MSNLIQSVIIGLAIALVALVGFVQSNKYIKTQAIDGCLKTAQIQETKDNQLITTPENYWYTFCMEEKGYETK